MTGQLYGMRILVVEDEYFVAMRLADILRDLGAEVVGPIGRLRAAEDAARRQMPDGAVLDVRLDSQMTTPLADMLQAAGVPVLLVTGYSADQLPDKLQDLPRLPKPLDAQALKNVAPAVFRPKAG